MSQLKILFITPHLSTGGAPQYLLKKISFLKDSCEVYCVEYENITGGVLVVQRNQISELLKDKLITLEENKQELVSIINKIKPDVIHFEEMPEYFCDYEVASKIYVSTRSYKIIETSHDSSFDIKNKLFFPDKFAFVSNYQKQLLADLNIPAEVVEYPVEYKEKKNRKSSLESLGLDPNKIHFLNVGLFTPRKNQLEIVEYAKKLTDQPVQFHFVGNQADNFKFYWEPLMKDFPPNCKWWGERKDTDTFYNAMDIFLFASKGTNNDKETSPLVLKEAIGWGMPVLMRKLDVYCGMHDKYPNVKYIYDDFEQNLSLIKSYIKNESRLNVFYEENTHKIHYEIKNPEGQPKAAKIVILDSYNKLTNSAYSIDDYSLRGWLISNAIREDVNGFSARLYSKDNVLLEEKEIVNFNKEKKLIPMVNSEELEMKHRLFDVSSWWSFCEIFIHKNYDIVQEGDVVVDIGANIGMLTAYALQNKASKIFSIEPDAETFKYLSSNVGKFNNVVLINNGVSNKDEELKFFSSEVSSISTIYGPEENQNISDKSINNSKETIINCLSPNTLFQKYKIEKIDFLKVDCEGAEFNFFEAIDESYLRNNISRIFCEVHAFAGTQQDYEKKIKSKLIRCGFEVEEDTNLLLNCILVFRAKKRKKIKIVHLLNDVESEREVASIKSLRQLEDYGFLYEQKITPVYKDKPPRLNCNRPDMISSAPGEYLLSPGHYGCYLAHRNGIVEGLNDDVDAILLNESDSVLQFKPEEIYEKIYEAYELCLKHDLAYISFGKQIKNYNHEQLEEDLYTADSLSEAHCILIPKSKWQYFKNKFETCPWDVSDLWYNIFIKEYRRGVFSRPYALQYPSYSKIDQTFKDGEILEIPNSLLKNFDNSDISVVIQTCDKYEFLWKGWFLSFVNNWAWDLGWQVYFCSEDKSLPYVNKEIKSINSPLSANKDGFSTRAIDILNKIKTKYVFYIQDDMWLDRKVDKQTMLEAFYNIKHFKWNCLKVHGKSWFNYSLLKTNFFANGIRILKQDPSSEYLLSHNASIWDREFLLSVMKENEDPWKNEQLGTERIKNQYKDPKIYHCDYEFYLPYGIAREGSFTEYGNQLLQRLVAKEENKIKYHLK